MAKKLRRAKPVTQESIVRAYNDELLPALHELDRQKRDRYSWSSSTVDVAADFGQAVIAEAAITVTLPAGERGDHGRRVTVARGAFNVTVTTADGATINAAAPPNVLATSGMREYEFSPNGWWFAV